MTMGLRRAALEERMRIENFQKAAYRRTEAAIGRRPMPLEWDYGAILRDCEIWLDEANNVLQGVLILKPMEDRLFLTSIATLPEAAGSGRGRALMLAAFERARELGKNRVGLITNSRNPAVPWYKRTGFSVDREDLLPDRSVLHMSASVPHRAD